MHDALKLIGRMLSTEFLPVLVGFHHVCDEVVVFVDVLADVIEAIVVSGPHTCHYLWLFRLLGVDRVVWVKHWIS